MGRSETDILFSSKMTSSIPAAFKAFQYETELLSPYFT